MGSVGCVITNASKQDLELVCTSSCCDICEMLTSYLKHAGSLSRNCPGKRSERTTLIYLVCQLWGLSICGFIANKNIRVLGPMAGQRSLRGGFLSQWSG